MSLHLRILVTSFYCLIAPLARLIRDADVHLIDLFEHSVRQLWTLSNPRAIVLGNIFLFGFLGLLLYQHFWHERYRRLSGPAPRIWSFFFVVILSYRLWVGYGEGSFVRPRFFRSLWDGRGGGHCSDPI